MTRQSRVQKAFETTVKALDKVVDPKTGMTKAEYGELLEKLIFDLEGRLEAVEEDLGGGDPEPDDEDSEDEPEEDDET